MPAAAPPPPPRRTRRARSHLVRVGEAFACADSGRFGGRPVGVALGSKALPGVVRDGPVGAADEQRHGGFGVAVERRIVQRRGPAGRRRRNRQSRRPTRSPDGAEGKGAPAAAALGVQVGARDDELLDDRVMAVFRRHHQGGAPKPAHGGAWRRGRAPISGYPSHRVRAAAHPSPAGTAGGPGGQPQRVRFFNSGEAD